MIEQLAHAIALVYLAAFAIALGYSIYGAQVASEHTLAYNLGRASGYLGLLARDPLRGAVAIVAVVLAVLLLSSIEFGERDDHSSNPPPDISPIHADTLRMPSTSPFERRRVAWPPFIGHRFELGADRP